MEKSNNNNLNRDALFSILSEYDALVRDLIEIVDEDEILKRGFLVRAGILNRLYPTLLGEGFTWEV